MTLKSKSFTIDLQTIFSFSPFFTTFILLLLVSSVSFSSFVFTFLFLYPTLISAIGILRHIQLNIVIKIVYFGMQLASLNPSSTTYLVLSSY